ncbi:MAG: septal ring lytic transglycosylase RlpA family protein [Acidobacteriaceae bacterium]
MMKSVEELPGKKGRKRTRAGMLVVTLGLTVSLAASPTVKPDNTVPANDSPSAKSNAKRHWFQIGKASWYGGNFNGRKTANGETYDMYAMTCAHRTLPLGSWVRVTNLSNRRSTILRVNDRGPMPMNRIVDLSYAAAKELGVEGLAKVRLESVDPTDQRLAEKIVAHLRLEDPSELKPAGEQLTASLLDPELVANFRR